MKTSLTKEQTRAFVERLSDADRRFSELYPGEGAARQPVHTVYGGAHLFKADSAKKLGGLGLRIMDTYAGDPFTFARVLELRGAERLPTDPAETAAVVEQVHKDPAAARKANPDAWLACTVYDRVREKLQSEPIEDFRIDFEDGYGNRPDEEEDAEAVRTAEAVAQGMKDGTLPPFLGIRIKPFTAEMVERGVRTLDLFMTTLGEKADGDVPPHFVVTLPKVTTPEQVEGLADLLRGAEQNADMDEGALKLEMMVEMPQAIIAHDGTFALPKLLSAAKGRCVAAHFGTYDYTAGVSITAQHQDIQHPSCDFAKDVMQVSLAGTGVWISDGATTVMPIGPHAAKKDGPPLSPAQVRENTETVHAAWNMHARNVSYALRNGFYQGWDLHPGQLATRYGAMYGFFLEGLDAAANRLRSFVDAAAQATLVGRLFDDAATGQGLLNFFLRAISCGAVTDKEATELTGLALEEIHSRSFLQIVDKRRAQAG